MRPGLTILAASFAAVSVALLVPVGSRRLPLAHLTDVPMGRHRRRAQGRTSGRLLLAPAAVMGTVAVTVLPGTSLAALAVAMGAGLAAARLAGRARELRKAEERRRSVADYCEALLGELRAGQPVPVAVERAVEAWPATEPVAAAARLGADVPTALRRLGAEPGATGLLRLAATWELCAATGSGLAVGVERLLETAQAEQAVQRLVHGELSAARATARLVAVLPVGVLLAAQGVGGRPWHFLFQTAVGVTCLGAGVALVATGLSWIDRIAARAVEGG